MILFLLGNLHSKSHILEYSTLISTMVIQQKDPWNFMYSIIPQLIYVIIGIIIRILHYNHYKVNYNWNQLYLSLLTLGLGTFFLVRGLDDKNDYLRINHGMWHITICVFGYFAFNAV